MPDTAEGGCATWDARVRRATTEGRPYFSRAAPADAPNGFDPAWGLRYNKVLVRAPVS